MRAYSRSFYVVQEIFVVHYFLARSLNLCLSLFAVCMNYLLVFLATFLSFPKNHFNCHFRSNMSNFRFISGKIFGLTELLSFRILFVFGIRLWETRIGSVRSGFIVRNILYLFRYDNFRLRNLMRSTLYNHTCTRPQMTSSVDFLDCRLGEIDSPLMMSGMSNAFRPIAIGLFLIKVNPSFWLVENQEFWLVETFPWNSFDIICWLVKTVFFGVIFVDIFVDTFGVTFAVTFVTDFGICWHLFKVVDTFVDAFCWAELDGRFEATCCNLFELLIVAAWYWVGSYYKGFQFNAHRQHF